MDSTPSFKTYLYLSHKKFIICVMEVIDLKIIYKQEFFIKDHSNELEFRILKDFLEKNIFKIEKKN